MFAHRAGNSGASGFRDLDAETGFEVTAEFKRFNQKYDMFNRAVWDEEVRSDRSRRFFESYFTDLAQFRKVEGFQHRDYALRNAAWYIADFTADLLEAAQDRKEGFLDTYTMFREGAKRKTQAPAEENTADVKRAGKFLGADAIGICEYDERWVYSHNYSRQQLTDKKNGSAQGHDPRGRDCQRNGSSDDKNGALGFERRRHRARLQPRYNRRAVSHPIHPQSWISRYRQP